VEQLPADVARGVSAKAGPLLVKSLSDALAVRLTRTLAPTLTKAVSEKLLVSVPEAVSPHVTTEVVSQVADTLRTRLAPRIAKGVAAALSRSLLPILIRSITHTLVSTLTAVLRPLEAPPADADDDLRRQAHCTVCRTAKAADDGTDGGAWAVWRAAFAGRPGGGERDAAELARDGGGDAASALALACEHCEHGRAIDRAASDLITQQVAHTVAEYYANYHARYAASAAGVSAKGGGGKAPASPDAPRKGG